MLNKVHGKQGEDIAAKFLASKGYKIVCRNWSTRWGEIDIICTKDGSLVFVEVKYRSSQDFGQAYEAVNYRKRRSLLRSFERYIQISNTDMDKWSFDVICVAKIDKNISIIHYENVDIL